MLVINDFYLEYNYMCRYKFLIKCKVLLIINCLYIININLYNKYMFIYVYK